MPVIIYSNYFVEQQQVTVSKRKIAGKYYGFVGYISLFAILWNVEWLCERLHLLRWSKIKEIKKMKRKGTKHKRKVFKEYIVLF